MEKEYNKYLWSSKQPRVYGISPLTISGTPMSEEDVAASLKVENSQQRFQQNPVVKRSEQWEAQQKQREEEIAASKKWLELHPEDESDSPYTILERGKHQAIVDGKDPSYYEKMIDDGKQFTKGALTVLSLPYLSAAAAGAYGYGASLGARGLFAGQGIYGLANKNGVRKTANLIKSGDYGKAALSGAGDALNAAMILPGAKFLGSAAKYGLKSTVAGDILGQNVRYAPQIGGRLVVSQDYFKDPTKFYRIGTTPEKLSIEYAGENVVSGSAESLGKVTPADAFRRTITKNSRIQPGKGANEGYWVLAPEQSNTKVTDLLQKVNSSHGGETQASAGTLWEGGLNSDSRFPTVIFEGTMPETIRASWNSTLGKSIGRSNFVRQPSENLPIGTRLGFKTGEMPIHSTSSFAETSPGSGKFFYNGEIIPENRIFSPQQFSKSNGKTYLGLLERPSKLSEAELKGVPKSVRNQPIRESTFDTRASNNIIETYSNGSWRTTRPFTEEQILAEKDPEVQANMKYSLEKWKKDNSNMYENYIDDTSKFNTDLQEYINSLNIEPSSRYLDGELIDGVRETNPFVKLYRQYLYNNGTDASSISNTDLAKLLTAQEQEIRSGMTGIMADKSPLWHGSNSLFDTFDWQKYASINTENAGAIGPGNYFSTQGVPYGFDRNLRRVRNMQPYFITDIRSTPSGLMMQNKGLLPEYRSKYELVHNPEWLQQEVKRIVPGQNTTLYIDYNEPMSGIMDVTRGAGMLRRNTGIKSLFPHPSRLVRGEDGLLKMLPTNWDDPRVNFKQGGILKRK